MKMKRLIAVLLALVLTGLCVISLADVITIDLAAATDEELAEAVAKIKAEQRSRMKTTILLDPAEATVLKGASLKVNASVDGLPEGVKAGKFTWSSSDEAVASCSNGTIKGNGAGKAVITCSAALSDGTEVSAEIAVTGLLPVKSLAFAGKTLDVMAGDVFPLAVTVTPDDASDKTVTFTSSDEKVIKVDEDGNLVALLNGKATITATANDGSGKTAKVTVNVTKRVGKYDDELTFQGLEWGSSDETVWKQLQEIGFVDPERNAHAYRTSSICYWPDNDLKFANYSAWRSLPVAFSDQEKGAASLSLEPLKKVGGYSPNNVVLYFLNSIKDGEVDSESTELCGVYIHFDNKHEPGGEIFANLLAKLESQYGEFTRYMAKYMTRKSYKDVYNPIKASMEGAKMFSYRELGKECYLSTQAICTLQGQNNTGIMLTVESDGEVVLFYGKTDALQRIESIRKILENVPDDKEDAGI